MEEFPSKKHRRNQLELNVVPILDMLVSIIFFLLLTTSFVGYSKLTLPPSSVSINSDPVAPPPLNPKIVAIEKNGYVNIMLTWEGPQPGHEIKKIYMKSGEDFKKQTINAVHELIQPFLNKYQTVLSIQIGLGPNVSYQTLISIMDGVIPYIKDHILVSYEEAVALFNNIGS